MTGRTALVLGLLAMSCGVGVVGETGSEVTPAVDGSTEAVSLRFGHRQSRLEQAAPLVLSASSVSAGQVLGVSVTWHNPGRAAYSVRALRVFARPVDGIRELVLAPELGATTVQAGGNVQLVTSFVPSASDAPGSWEALSRYQRSDGTWAEGPSARFEVIAVGADAGTPPVRVDAGTPPVGVDAGTPPVGVDAGTPPPVVVDAGTPPPVVVDAGTPPPVVVDAGTPPPVVVDAGTPPPVAVDAGTPPPTGALVEPVSPGAGDVTFTIRADSDVRAISPLIYGVNQVNDLAGTQRGVGLVRAGGNRWTAYNWENNASNAGIDYLNENDNYLVMNSSTGDVPGDAVRSRVQTAQAGGAVTMVTIPIQGYAAADKLGNGDVNQSANYLQTRFVQNVARKPSALSLSPSLTDGVVYQDEFTNWLKAQYPTAFAASSPRIVFSLDNEPDLWADSHPRIQPAVVTAATLIAKNIEFATAVKSVIPTATVAGFVSYGYYGFVALQGNYSADFTAYYLDQMRLAGVAANQRLIDVLDLHWYPEATGGGTRIIGTDTSSAVVAARLQAPRSLWDPTYTETSWVANAEGAPLKLIPNMQARIAAHYPGTKLGFTEYSYGGGTDISGAIAEADVLGIFGREGVYMASFWDLNSTSTMTYAGLRAFTSFDEAGAHFGDTSVRATSSNVANTSVYASIDAATPGRMVIVAINKTAAPLTAAISLAGYRAYTSATVHRVTASSSTVQAAASVTATTRNGFLYVMPAYSVSVLVPQ